MFIIYRISLRFPFIGIDLNIFSASEIDILKLQKCVILVLPATGTCLYV
ncbi:hypothetical protein YKV138 [Yokapox virus]|uniref:Uncharacterized protein n=1 Tax=Yokapox virus TaxID=1076255 RepID=G3EI30_9POXV|nr:hypothetical protein YKV138 [Yokapox virus]AEN03727.1 hypothetical protein YKV138 [Yokapox virus]